MGCDIHTYVEFAENPENPYWQNFTRNGGSRNYLMFGIMAGVRVPDAAIFEPKGVPADLGYFARGDYTLTVAPADKPEYAEWDGWCSEEQADRWVKSGCSVDVGDSTYRKVTHPDYHSASWLTPDEFEKAVKTYSGVSEKYYSNQHDAPPEWHAMLAAMRAFEARGCLARIVFWFDN